MLEAILWSALATATLLIGMALAYRNLVNLKWTGLIMAFGAGAIISAATYQLIATTQMAAPIMYAKNAIHGSTIRHHCSRINVFVSGCFQRSHFDPT